MYRKTLSNVFVKDKSNFNSNFKEVLPVKCGGWMSLEIWIPYQCRYNTLNILCQISRVRCPKVLCTLFFHACLLNLCTYTFTHISQAVKPIWESKRTSLFLYVRSCCQALTHLLYIFSNWNRLFVKCTCVMITVVLIIGNTYKLSSHA